MDLNAVVALAGLLVSFLLFYKFPLLHGDAPVKGTPKISVIIPARNEEANLPLLLKDLKRQTMSVHEVICVDDASTDNTAALAISHGAKLISIKDKPQGWTGKAWACQIGALAAEGDLLLFLDADVRLKRHGIGKLACAYGGDDCVISVQPYHRMVHGYEQFSFFFNIIQIAANGVSLPFQQKTVGLYGPVILIDKADYDALGGHFCARSSIVDDLALGERLQQSGIGYRLFIGGDDVSFRMYGGGFKFLLQGWTKNFATGASKTPFALLLMVFLWVTSCASVPIYLVQSILRTNIASIAGYMLLYCAWVLELRRISIKLGNFTKAAPIAYPVYLAVFLWAFVLSLMKKIFRLKVIWKGREIDLGD